MKVSSEDDFESKVSKSKKNSKRHRSNKMVHNSKSSKKRQKLEYINIDNNNEVKKCEKNRRKHMRRHDNIEDDHDHDHDHDEGLMMTPKDEECNEVLEKRSFTVIVKMLLDEIIGTMITDEKAKRASEEIIKERIHTVAECYYGKDLLQIENVTLIDVNSNFTDQKRLLSGRRKTQSMSQFTYSITGIVSASSLDLCYTCVIGDGISRESRRRMEEGIGEDEEEAEEQEEEGVHACLGLDVRGSLEEELISTELKAFETLYDAEVIDISDCAKAYNACVESFASASFTCSNDVMVKGCPLNCCCSFIGYEKENRSSLSRGTCLGYKDACGCKDMNDVRYNNFLV